MMEELSQRVSPNDLNVRIDATYYRPTFVRNHLRLRDSGLDLVSLSDVVTSGRRAVYFSTETLERESAPEAWVPFLTADDLGTAGFFVDIDARRAVSPSFADRYPNGQLRANELLVKVKGPNQITAYCEEAPSSIVLVSGTIWGALVRGELIDPSYLVAAMSSSYAVTARTRLRTNLNVEFLSPTDLLSLQLPTLRSKKAQRFVGDKVRQAVCLRDLARLRESQFRKHVGKKYFNLNDAIPNDSKHGRAKPSQLNGRLNPGAFTPDRLHVRSYLKQNGGRRVGAFATIETPVTSNFQSTDQYLGLDSIGSALGTITPSTIGAEDVTGSVRILSEGPVISKLRPYLNKVAYIPPHLSRAFGSTELLCVRANDPLLNWYLCGVLQLSSTVRQLNPVSTGSTHPRVTRYDILDCYVPWIEDAINVGLLLADAQKAYFLSDMLVAAAKSLVEALIDREITEDDLSDVQLQLEQGDQTNDRLILGRLYEGGLDAADTRPLFPDLDCYYETLQMAEQALAEGGDE